MAKPVQFHASENQCRFVPAVFSRLRPAHWRRRAAFSLIEVVLALAVLATSFVVIFGMIPFGLGMMSSSIDATIGMQIVQRVTTVARQSKFSELGNLGTDSSGKFFFNDEGVEVPATDPFVVYSAAVVLLPQTTVPTGDPTARVQIANPNIATINIIIKKNAAKQPLRVVNVLISNNGL